MLFFQSVFHAKKYIHYQAPNIQFRIEFNVVATDKILIISMPNMGQITEALDCSGTSTKLIIKKLATSLHLRTNDIVVAVLLRGCSTTSCYAHCHIPQLQVHS